MKDGAEQSRVWSALESEAIDAIIFGDIKGISPHLREIGGTALEMLATLADLGHLRLVLPTQDKTAMRQLRIATYLDQQEGRGFSTESAIAAAQANFAVDGKPLSESTVWRAKRQWTSVLSRTVKKT